MAKAKIKAQSNKSSVDKSIASARDIMTKAIANAQKAAKTVTVNSKKLNEKTKTLKTKQGALKKREKIAAMKLKKKPSVGARKTLKKVSKDIASVLKDIAAVTKAKDANSIELASLKDSVKRVSGYLKAMKSVDSEIPKSKPPAKKKKAAKKPAAKKAKAPAAKKPAKPRKKKAPKSDSETTRTPIKVDIPDIEETTPEPEKVEEEVAMDASGSSEVGEVEITDEFDNEETTEEENRNKDTIS